MSAYIIAEIGINHNGSLESCLKMIDSAVEAGCNAVKFQLFKAKYLYPESAGELDWQNAETTYKYDIYKACETFELPERWIDKLIEYCAAKNIDFLCSVFDTTCVDFLADKGIKTVKLSSYTVTNIPLIRHCAQKGLSIIQSTGGALLSEIEEAVSTVLEHHDRLSLLHCSIRYPTQLEDCNLGVIQTLSLAFPSLNIGWSDHTAEVSDAPVQAIYLGAKVVEKHITLDKLMEGPDHFFALNPEELKIMVSDIRQAEIDFTNNTFTIDRKLYGSSAKTIDANQQYLRDFAYMRLYAARDIKKGNVISVSDISILRSGKKQHGLEPKYLALFEKHTITAKEDIQREDPITWDVFLS